MRFNVKNLNISQHILTYYSKFYKKWDDSMRMKQFWKDKKAVSPVIAVVLLVAITVVLVSVLYFSVSGMITKTKTTPVAALYFVES